MEEEIRLSLGARLREERERLGFSQSAFGALGGVSLRTEQDWERGVSAVKSDFLAVAAEHGVDVLYVVTGVRGPKGAKLSGTDQSAVTEEDTVPRNLTREQAALLDNYEAADERGRAAARSVLDALAKQKAA